MKHNTPVIRPPFSLGSRQHLVLLLLLLLALPAVMQAQFTYTTNDGAITITGYTGSGGAVTIPATITGLPVTTLGDFAFDSAPITSVTIPSSVNYIGNYAFQYCTNLTNVTIPNSVRLINFGAFLGCSSLAGISLPNGIRSIQGWTFNLCTSLTNITIPNSVTFIRDLAFHQCDSLTTITIPDSVTRIGEGLQGVFAGCDNLANVSIGNGVTAMGSFTFKDCARLTNVVFGTSRLTNLGDFTFSGCTNLKTLYFKGNRPNGNALLPSENSATIYYLPGTTGWGSTFFGRPTALWLLPNPLILTKSPSFGVQTNQFGFRVSWATNVPVVVEASADLATAFWTPLTTNSLAPSGWFQFSDPEWTNHPSRIYRVRSQ